MWHATWMHENRGDSWFLVVGSQISNLIPNPSFGHKLCFKYQMGHASPFKTSMFQELSNDIKNFSIQWFLTLVITFWKFGNPFRLQLPKWKLIWECRGSFPLTFLHYQEHEMWLPGSLLAHTFASPCLGREPKARVVTWTTIYNTTQFGCKFNIIRRPWIIVSHPPWVVTPN
jgi:hypothetical protein